MLTPVRLHLAVIGYEKRKKQIRQRKQRMNGGGMEVSVLTVNLRLDTACGMTSARVRVCVCVYARVFHCARV